MYEIENGIYLDGCLPYEFDILIKDRSLIQRAKERADAGLYTRSSLGELIRLNIHKIYGLWFENGSHPLLLDF